VLFCGATMLDEQNPDGRKDHRKCEGVRGDQRSSPERGKDYENSDCHNLVNQYEVSQPTADLAYDRHSPRSIEHQVFDANNFNVICGCHQGAGLSKSIHADRGLPTSPILGSEL
jgi:hypothetical protein